MSAADPRPTRSRRRSPAAVALVAAVLVAPVAACGGDGDDSAAAATTGFDESLRDTTRPGDDAGGESADPADAPERAQPGEVVLIDSSEAAALRAAQPDTLFVDVRTQEEYIAGHMVGAQNVSFEDAGLWQRRTEPLDRDRPTVVYCRTGNRSAQAAQDLVERGFTEVYDLGGIGDWNEGDLPVDR